MLQDLLLENVEFVVDGAGQKKRAQLPWAIWEALLDYVRNAEEDTPTPEFVAKLEQAEVEIDRGEYINFEDIRRDV